jgi:ketosteroid isomerase-like protein
VVAQSNVEIVRRFYDAYLMRDRAAVAAVVDAEVDWHTIAGPIFGVDVLRGRDELLAFMFEELLEGMPDFAARIEELTELDDKQVLVVGHYVGHGTASGASVEMSTAAIFRVEDRRIVSFTEFGSKAEAVAAAGERVADRSQPGPDPA